MIRVEEKHGKWSGKSVFSFNGTDGANPAAGLSANSNGVIYGTTQYGGTRDQGTVFSLVLINGVWTETVLYNFSGGADGGQPGITIVQDKSSGTLFGTTPAGGGNSGCGTAFDLVPSGNNWTFNTLYSFAGGSDGCSPETAIHEGVKSGTLFSTTRSGGARNSGTVFELAEVSGHWTESTLYSFTGGRDGSTPTDVDLDKSGNIFGVTSAGGTYGSGAVYELSKAHQRWAESVLYSFSGGYNGSYPTGLHLEKTTGTLYGTTEFGGSDGYGTVFRLAQSGNSWTQTVLHSFGTAYQDGLYPQSRPSEDPQTGVLYGTTVSGGKTGGGVVYEIIP